MKDIISKLINGSAEPHEIVAAKQAAIWSDEDRNDILRQLYEARSRLRTLIHLIEDTHAKR